MIKRFYHPDKDKYYSLTDLKKNNSRITYWLVLPQGITKKHRSGTMFTRHMMAKTFKKAMQLAVKYDAPIIQRMIESKLGRWQLKEWVNPEVNHLTNDEIWDLYMTKPEIDLSKIK